jgi:signal transduction histidine kinase
MVVGDPDSITQVVYNLLDNAVKFSPEGAVVTLSVWKQNDKAYISVKNTGETIPQSELPLIFNRFHKTDRSRGLDKEGVGLGLYIVKAIIDNHKENVYVTSSEGVTEFVFTLTLKS